MQNKGGRNFERRLFVFHGLMLLPDNYKKRNSMSQLPDHEIIKIISSASEELLVKDNKLFENLSACINDLIINDFERLVSLLYRMDINEKKLEYLLAQQPGTDVADSIAALVIERQLQKIKSRQENRRDINDVTDEEKW